MFGLSVGIAHVGSTLPRAVYALLSGLNAATVGIIACAAVQLSTIAITDKLTKILVFLTGAAGLLYKALWYFPVLIFAAGAAAVTFDYHWFQSLAQTTEKIFMSVRRSRTSMENVTVERGGRLDSNSSTIALRNHETRRGSDLESRTVPQDLQLDFSWKSGTAIITIFFLMFITVMVLRGVLQTPRILYSLFANLFLAGTIIFGGGPVVVPLLREYIVAEG